MLDNAEDHHASDDHAFNLLDDDCALLGKLLDDCLKVEVRLFPQGRAPAHRPLTRRRALFRAARRCCRPWRSCAA